MKKKSERTELGKASHSDDNTNNPENCFTKEDRKFSRSLEDYPQKGNPNRLKRGRPGFYPVMPDMANKDPEIAKQSRKKRRPDDMQAKTSITLKFTSIAEIVPSNSKTQLKSIMGLVTMETLADLLSEDIFTTNPREAAFAEGSKETITNVTETLLNEPENLSIYPNALVFSFHSTQTLERNRLKVFVENTQEDGMIDGSHRGHGILRGILAKYWVGEELNEEIILPTDNVASQRWKEQQNEHAHEWNKERKERERLLRGSITYKDVAALYNENRQSILNAINEADEEPTEVMVQILTPVNADTLAYEEYKDRIINTSEARNSNTDVTRNTMDSHMGIYEELKNVLPQNIADAVEWRTGDDAVHKRFRSSNGDGPEKSGKPHKPSNLSTYTLPFLNKAIEYLCEESGIDALNEFVTDQKKIYSARTSASHNFSRIMRHELVSDKIQSSDAPPYYKIQSAVIKNALNLSGEIPEIADYMYAIFPKLACSVKDKGLAAKNIKLFTWRNEECVPEGIGNADYQPKLFTSKREQALGGVLPFSKTWDDQINHKFAEGLIVPYIVTLDTIVNIDDEGNMYWLAEPRELIYEAMKYSIKNYLTSFWGDSGGGVMTKYGKTDTPYTHAIGGYETALRVRGFEID